jgi:hypothetical protein
LISNVKLVIGLEKEHQPRKKYAIDRTLTTEESHELSSKTSILKKSNLRQILFNIIKPII